MHRPSISELLNNNESYYSLVIAVAKKAREIAQNAEDNGVILEEKTVNMAVEDFANGEYRLIEKQNIGQTIE